MTDNNHHIAVLIGKFLDNSLSAEQLGTLEEWINASDNNRDLFTELTDQQQLTNHLQRFYAYDSVRITHKIGEAIPQFLESPVIPIRTTLFKKKWGWAAAILLLLAGNAYYWSTHQANTPAQSVASHIDIQPGTQGAILTLADGKQVVLDSMNSGVVANQKGASIVLSKGELIYDPTTNNNADLEYNTMTTPKGRQFQVTLPDGTRAWLNAASSIRYPTAFTTNERRVEVTGEVYFEVVKNANKPFFVSIGDNAVIEVIGTSFNINAYDNEQFIRTTLIDGSVKVAIASATNDNSLVLKPGQQARITDKKVNLADKQDIDKIMAWKNGFFNFDGADLEEVMRQLERWYNIEVVYENGIPHTRFIGEMSRQIALTDLLEILKRTEVDFRVEGRKLIVLNK
ncbi:FecR domain-containing protein [Chitinophaga pendula]|uniref:FecR family protein n=1 Tax=Chitinophaga TaxID=79328 RepID=UPI000BB019CC|nr:MULTISPECIES: FecR family protein [Chitinophaga]ASZ09639.1 iron dicitrate transport regulator FecR [Chitinophaga sp. MD30]UCJ07429.1 FecR domain-containing protein [Chitinophaga pendula]